MAVEFGRDQICSLQVAAHAGSWFETVALEFTGDVGCCEFFVARCGAAAGERVAGEEVFVRRDPLGFYGPGLLSGGRD